MFLGMQDFIICSCVIRVIECYRMPLLDLCFDMCYGPFLCSPMVCMDDQFYLDEFIFGFIYLYCLSYLLRMICLCYILTIIL